MTIFYEKEIKKQQKIKIISNFKGFRSKITVSDLAKVWLNSRQATVKQSTFSTYSVLINRHIVPYFKCICPKNADIQRFVSDKSGELSAKTIKDLLMILKMIFRYGTSKYGVVCPEIEAKFENNLNKVEVFSLEEHRKILNYLRENFSLKNLGIFITLTTGLRIGEVCALKWGDVDIREGVICVNKTVQRIYDTTAKRTKLIISGPKTHASVREIPICAELKKILKSLKPLMYDKNYVLTNSEHPLEPRTYREYYRRILNGLNIAYRKFHVLRHSFATRCIESHCDYKTVSTLLGHTSISTTLNLYVHPTTAQKRKCINKMLKSLNI